MKGNAMKVRFAVLVVLLFACASAIAQSAATAQPQVTVIRAGTLIDPRANEPKHNQAIVIRGERIEAVGDAARVNVPAGADVMDLSNATVLPGMIESHTHIILQGEDPARGGYDNPVAEVLSLLPGGAGHGVCASRP